ncbi:MAG: glycosyltransferase [Pseudomonadota bacterium]
MAEGIAAVIIGRNEGERLKRCLASVVGRVDLVIYVDSGSTDGSREAAHALGAEVIELDLTRPFTAARARNAGFHRAMARETPPTFIQFIDGDCELRDGWLEAAADFLEAHPKAAVAAGRLRERFPEASVYNRLCDREWDTPLGEVAACGGIAMMRADAFAAAGGFDEGLIAGEEPELCLRLRRAGWQIWRLSDEMAWHDAAMTRFGQWWRRATRAGHTYVEGWVMHGAAPERHGVVETRRALAWGLVLPLTIGIGTAIHPATLVLVLAYPAQIIRLARREGLPWAFFNTLAKFAETRGIISYGLDRLRGINPRLIEYK